MTSDGDKRPSSKDSRNRSGLITEPAVVALAGFGWMAFAGSPTYGGIATVAFAAGWQLGRAES